MAMATDVMATSSEIRKGDKAEHAEEGGGRNTQKRAHEGPDDGDDDVDDCARDRLGRSGETCDVSACDMNATSNEFVTAERLTMIVVIVWRD
jgi:hypothetical protein